MATKIMFLHELKDEDLLVVEWISNVFMCSDLFTKNLGDKDFKRHTEVYVGKDQYE